MKKDEIINKIKHGIKTMLQNSNEKLAFAFIVIVIIVIAILCVKVLF